MLANVGGSSTAAPPPPPPPPPTDKTGDAGKTGAGAKSFDATVASVQQGPKPATPQSGDTNAPKGSSGSGTNASSNIDGLVAGLKGDGDSATVSLQAGARVGLPLEEIGFPGIGGPQLQYGYDATVKQVGSGKDAQYQVTFDKDLMAGLNEQAQTPGYSVSLGKVASLDAGATLGVEENLITAGTVTMSFSSKADLSRGLSALKQTAEAQSLRDFGAVESPRVEIAAPKVSGSDLASVGHDASKTASDGGGVLSSLWGGVKDAVTLHPISAAKDVLSAGGHAVNGAVDAGKTVFDVGKTVYHTGKGEVVDSFNDNVTKAGNFVRNPLDQWSPDPGLNVPVPNPAGFLIRAGADFAADKVGPSAQDTQFLKDHITGYGVTGGLQLRGRLEASLGGTINLGGIKAVAQAIGQPRLADNAQITLGETLPKDGKPGTVSITFANKVNFDNRSLAQFTVNGPVAPGKQNGNNVRAGSMTDPNVASATAAVTLTYNLTPQQSKQLANAGHSLSITDLVPTSKLGHPDQVTATLDYQHATPVDGNTAHETLTDQSITKTFDDPKQALDALKSTVTNPFEAIPSLVRGSTRETDVYDQHGVPTQNELGARLNDIGEGKVWLYQQNTSETRTQHTVTGPDTGPHQAPAPKPYQPPPSHDQQLVVLPHDGLNIHSTPNTRGGKLGAFTSGTFVQTAGQRAVDAHGNQWVRVTGPDAARKSVTGWVEAKYVTPHAQGGENATGRIDQSLRGYIPITVRPGDTVDGIAGRYGKDPGQAVAVNQGHVIDPNLIFPGDTVYLPSGAARH